MKSLVAVVSFAAVLLVTTACGDAEQPAAMPTADAEQPAADAGEGRLFRAQQRFPVGETPRSVAVADLNGDGDPDVVTVNTNSDDVSVLLGNGDGSFQPQQRYPARATSLIPWRWPT